MSSMDEDKQIIERVLQGEKEAFAMIVEKYQKSLFNYIGRMVGERELALDFTADRKSPRSNPSGPTRAVCLAPHQRVQL